MRRISFGLVGFLAMTAAGCGGGGGGGDGTPDAGPPPNPFAVPCGDTLDDVYVDPTDLPAFDADQRGKIVRCAYDQTLSVEELLLRIEELDMRTEPATSGTAAYRIAYRSSGTGGVEDIGTALVFVPAKPIANPPPVVVVAHGAVGLSMDCAASKDPLMSNVVEGRFDINTGMYLAIASAGYVVVAPDNNHHASGGTMPFLSAEVEAYSILDATRAVHELLPDGVADETVFFGLSHGGHGVLSAQAYVGDYGMAGTLAGTIAYSPMWFAIRGAVGLLGSTAGFDTATDAKVLWFGMMYAYDSALRNGDAEGGVSMVIPAKQALADEIIPAVCHEFESDYATMAQLGSVPSEWLTPSFAQLANDCGLLGYSCDQGDGVTWWPRFKADRPPLDAAQGAPVQVFFGKNDALISPGIAYCARDKMVQDMEGGTTPLTVCGDADADHTGVVRQNMQWGLDWIGARLLGAAEPAACDSFEVLGSTSCQVPPGFAD